MKRLLTMALVVMMSLGLAVAAQANVFEQGGNFKIKFTGVEYLYTGGDFDAMMNGDTTTVSEIINQQTGELNTDFSMSSILYMTNIYSTETPGGIGQEPPLYGTNNDGVYIAVLRDLTIASTEGSITPIYSNGVFTGHYTSAKAYFAGGTLDWFYLDPATVAATGLSASVLANLSYVDGIGFVDGRIQNPTAADRISLDGLEAFASFDLIADGYANISYNAQNQVEGHVAFYGDVVGGTLKDQFDSNLYGNNGGAYDLYFNATLTWKGDHFHVDDPANVSATATPEPSSIILMSLGILLTAMYVRRQRRV